MYSSIRNTSTRTRIQQYADTHMPQIFFLYFIIFFFVFFFTLNQLSLLKKNCKNKNCAFRSVSPALDPQVLRPSSSASAAYLSASSSSSHSAFGTLLLPTQPHTRFEDAAAPLSLLTLSHGTLFASSQSLLDSHSSPRSFFILFFLIFSVFFSCFERQRRRSLSLSPQIQSRVAHGWRAATASGAPLFFPLFFHH
jgi:hypothetical protein